MESKERHSEIHSLMFYLESYKAKNESMTLAERKSKDYTFYSTRCDEFKPDEIYNKIKKILGIRISEMEGEILRQGRILLKKEKKRKYKEIPKSYIDFLSAHLERYDIEVPEDLKKEIREHVCKKIDDKYKAEMNRLSHIFD